MENILILNFKKLGDILSMAHLIHSLKNQYPQAAISVLVYKECEKAAQCLKHLSQIYTIDRKKIIALKKNRLFPRSYAVNEFAQDLAEIKSVQWDHIVNFSNDLMSCYVMGTLNYNNFIGIGINNNNQVVHSNQWALLFNEVLAEYRHTPVHFADCYHRMMNLNWIDEEVKILTNPEHNKTAYDNFKLLKKRLKKGEDTKIIAIQCKSAVPEKDIPYQTLVELLKMLLNDKNFYPVIIFAPLADEIEFVNKLNAEFNNSLLSIEADLAAVPSVLINVDALISPDTSIKHMADLVSTPLLEVVRGPSPFLKQGSVNPYNLLLREQNLGIEISAVDIHNALYFLFDYSDLEDLSFSDTITLYQSQKDGHGVSYKYLKGYKRLEQEVSRQMSRYYVFKLIDNYADDNIIRQLLVEFNREELYQWIDTEKEKLTQTVKQLLNTIKSLKAYKFGPNKNTDFVYHLDELLKSCEIPHLVAIPTLLFRGKLETLEGNTLENNLRDIESLLYELKNNIHILTTCLTNLTSLEYKQRKANNTPARSAENSESARD